MRIAITTRSCNDMLYSRMESFLPPNIPRIRYMGMNHWSDALTYLEKILQLDYDYVINIDEDCFVIDWTTIDRIIQFMAQDGYTHFGMPDHVISHPLRNNSKYVHNPFFNIFDVKQCLEIINTKPNVKDYPCEMDECFNVLFQKLYFYGKPANMCTSIHADKITTVGTVNPYLMHTWYSRTYGNDPYHTKRIDNIYNEAKALCSNSL